MYDLFLFSTEDKFEEIEKQLSQQVQLEKFLYDSFYRDLLDVGDDFFLKTKINSISKKSKILSLERAIKYYSQPSVEEYEKCSHMQILLNKLKGIK